MTDNLLCLGRVIRELESSLQEIYENKSEDEGTFEEAEMHSALD